MGDLRGLIEAVERGECADSMFCAMFHSQGLCTECERAFLGSLDAAKALHEALLPGYGWMMGDLGSVTIIPRNVTGPTCRVDNNPARAWLLAILRALEAEGRG